MDPNQQKINEAEKKFYLKKITWLYVGVSIFSAIIIIFFVLALKANFKSYSWKKTGEQKIVNSVKNNIQDYLDKEKADLKKQESEAAAEEARNKLNELITNYQNKQQGEPELSAFTTDTEEQISE